MCNPVQLRNYSPLSTWTHTDTHFNCLGSACKSYTLTVSTEGAVSDLSPVSECKHGNNVKLHLQSVYDDQIYVYEIAIVGNPGKLCIQNRLILPTDTATDTDTSLNVVVELEDSQSQLTAHHMEQMQRAPAHKVVI
ncbi:hypothetical protein ACHWQZ_G005193 [Mnemiopsis leidyi]